MTALYELAGQYLAIQELAESGEISRADLADTFEAISGEYDDKAIAVIQVAQNFDSTVSAIDAEIARLNKLKITAKNQQVRLREYLRDNMERTGITKIDHPLFKITLVAGRDTVEIVDEDKIPDEYMSVEVSQKANKAEILKKLKTGEHIPGVSLGKSKPALRIK